MQRHRVLSLIILVVMMAIPLMASPGTHPSISADKVDSPQYFEPIEVSVTSDSYAYVYDWDSVSGHGEVTDFANIIDDDAAYARLIEVDTDEGFGTNFGFERLFMFTCEAFHYLKCRLEVKGYDYTGVSGYWHENLRFSYSTLSIGPWTELGEITAESSTRYSWPMEAPDDIYFYIKVQSTGDSLDWGSKNEWRLEYLRVWCEDRKSTNQGVSINTVHDGDNLYPYKGAGTDDYYEFACSTSNEEGSSWITRISLTAETEAGSDLWHAEWKPGPSWSLSSWSDGVNLLVSECYLISSSQVRTAVFAIQFRYDCDDVSDIDFILYHESNTWNASSKYDKTSDGKDLDQKPTLIFGATPTISTRCDSGSSPQVTGSVQFEASTSGVAPHPSHAYVQTYRTNPAPAGQWSDETQLDSSGNFAIGCLTKGVAGTINRFRVRLYESSASVGYTGLEGHAQTICDEIVAFDNGTLDDWIPLDTTTMLFTKVKYLSDDAPIESGTMTWSGVAMSYNSESARWEGATTAEAMPTTIFYDQITMTTSEGVTVVHIHPITGVTWYRKDATIQVDFTTSSVLTSTVYDPTPFIFDVWLTDEDGSLMAGWIDLSIGSENISLYCDGVSHQSFSYHAIVAGEYMLYASFAGDALHNPANFTIQGLTALTRDLSIESSYPDSMQPLVQCPFNFYDVFDADFQGIFEGVTYVYDFPVNVSFSIWWTLSPTYSDLLVYVDTWEIIGGKGSGNWMLPWDLNGDGRLTETDFECYIVIILDGKGVYENITINSAVDLLQPVSLDLEIPSLTYSDSATMFANVSPAFDSTFKANLDLQISFYLSLDNSSWIQFDTMMTDDTGCGQIEWLCTEMGTVYFKVVTDGSSYYSQALAYASTTVSKESTILTIVHADRFTFSDQGVIVGHLCTDDDAPLSDYLVFLEVSEGDWISIGSGMTNETGHVSILWVPSLPAGIYSIRLRAQLTESDWYTNPDYALGQLEIDREILLIEIDTSTVAQGHIFATVIDDDGNPVDGIQVHLYVGEESEPTLIGATNSDGSVAIEVSEYAGERLIVAVDEDLYYRGATAEFTVSYPPDWTPMIGLLGGLFAVGLALAPARKFLRERHASESAPPKEEIRKDLSKEADAVSERRMKESERKIEILDGATASESVSVEGGE
jgi:hypothetical protein